MSVRLEQLSFSYGAQPVLTGVDLRLDSAVTAVIGPNAAGKTTLLRCISGSLKPQGKVWLNGKDARKMSHRERASAIGYLGQDTNGGAELTVMEAVLLGRYRTLSWRVSDDDLALTCAVLEDLGIGALALRPLSQLSGGQRQMVAIAQVLVQQPRVLLMDEPTNNLDLQFQLELLALIREMSRERDLTTLLALHDVNLAARFADRIVVLFGTQIHACGAPADVLTPETLRLVYGVNARVDLDADGIPVVTPLNSVRTTRSLCRPAGSMSSGRPGSAAPAGSDRDDPFRSI